MNSPSVVSISYPTLVSSPLSLEKFIEQAFGSHPQALGIIIVKDLPVAYQGYRESLLKFGYKFAHLPEETKERYTDPESSYSFGWSHGKVSRIRNHLRMSVNASQYLFGAGNHEWETRQALSSELIMATELNRDQDTLKGSYYANPVIDVPDVSPELREQHQEFYRSNIWPARDEKGIEGFEEAFKNLGRFVFKVGCELAAACQPFVSKHLTDMSVSLPHLISTSQTTKARLLHYFPPSPGSVLPSEDEPIDSWCGFHLDNSLLTGLCSAMFIRDGDEEPTVVSSPSPTSGLYIRTRGGDLTKVSIPADCLAFQTGESLELVTGKKLRATPHCVRVGGGDEKTSRETFAVFMQPDTDQKVSPTETFGQFGKRVLAEHYENSSR